MNRDFELDREDAEIDNATVLDAFRKDYDIVRRALVEIAEQKTGIPAPVLALRALHTTSIGYTPVGAVGQQT